MRVNADLTLADELDSDGDLEITIYISDWGRSSDIARWLNRDEAKALIKHLNKLFNFEDKAQ